MVIASWTRTLAAHTFTLSKRTHPAHRPRTSAISAHTEIAPDRDAAAARHTSLDGSLTVVVDASPEATLGAVRHLDLTAHINRALHALDADGRFPLAPTRLDPPRARPLRIGCIWRIGGAGPERRAGASEFDSFAHPGHVKISWAIDVVPAEQGSLLSITTRFTTTDEAANGRLLDAWSVVAPLHDALRARAAHTVKAYAEDLEEGEQVGVLYPSRPATELTVTATITVP